MSFTTQPTLTPGKELSLSIGPMAGLDTVEGRGVSAHAGNRDPKSSVVQRVYAVTIPSEPRCNYTVRRIF